MKDAFVFKSSWLITHCRRAAEAGHSPFLPFLPHTETSTICVLLQVALELLVVAVEQGLGCWVAASTTLNGRPFKLAGTSKLQVCEGETAGRARECGGYISVSRPRHYLLTDRDQESRVRRNCNTWTGHQR